MKKSFIFFLSTTPIDDNQSKDEVRWQELLQKGAKANGRATV